MEDKYSQLEMDVGDVERVETELFGAGKERKPYQRYPANMKIDESQLMNDEEEDAEIELISPNEEVFQKVSGAIRKSNTGSNIPDSAWNRKDDSGEYPRHRQH